MSVIFKGLKMPKNCIECIARIDTLRGDIICCVNKGLITYETISAMGRPVWCPANELKNHGDLIDKDVTINSMDAMLIAGKEYEQAVKYAKLLIEHRSPVIEADKEENK